MSSQYRAGHARLFLLNHEIRFSESLIFTVRKNHFVSVCNENLLENVPCTTFSTSTLKITRRESLRPLPRQKPQGNIAKRRGSIAQFPSIIFAAYQKDVRSGFRQITPIFLLTRPRYSAFFRHRSSCCCCRCSPAAALICPTPYLSLHKPCV